MLACFGSLCGLVRRARVAVVGGVVLCGCAVKAPLSGRDQTQTARRQAAPSASGRTPKKAAEAALLDGKLVSACPASAPNVESAGAAPRQSLQSRDTGKTEAVALGPGGRLAMLGEDFTIRIWDANSRFLVRSIRLPGAPFVPRLSWDATGEKVSVVGIESKDTYDLHGKLVERASPKLAFPAGVAAPKSPYDVGLVVAESGLGAAAIVETTLTADVLGPRGPRQLVVWPNREAAAAGRLLPVQNPASLALSSNGSLLAVTVVTGREFEKMQSEVQVIPLAATHGKPRRVASLTGYARVLAVSDDGNLLALTTMSSGASEVPEEVMVLDGAGKTLWRHSADTEDENGRARQGQIATASLGGDAARGRLLALVTADGRVQTFDARSGRYQGTLGTPVRRYNDVKFLNDDWVVALSPWEVTLPEGHVSLWSLKNAALLRSEEAPNVKLVDAASNGRISLHASKPSERCGQYGRYLDLTRFPSDPAKPAGAVLSARDPKPPCIEGLFGVEALDLAHDRLLVSRNMPPPGEKRYRPDDAIVELVSLKTTVLEDSDVGIFGEAGQGFTRDGRFILGGRPNDDLSWSIWDAKTGKQLRAHFGIRREGDGKLQVGAAAVSPDSEQLAVGLRRVVSIRNLRTDAELQKLTLDEDVSALSYGADAHTLLLGDLNGTLHVYRDGRQVGQADSDGGTILSIAVGRNGKTVVTTGSDGALRVWDVKSVRMLAVLAEFADDEWIAYTPAGAYGGTSEVADRVGWSFDAPLEGFRFEQFAKEFRNPDAVKRRLNGDPGDLVAKVSRPPRVAFTEAPPSAVAGKSVKLKLQASATGRVDSVRAFVEGRFAAAAPVCAAQAAVELEVPLLPGTNRVNVVAFDAQGLASNAAIVDIVSSDAAAAKPDLYVVAVGVNHYPHLPQQLQLAGADNDARSVASAFAAMQGKSYAKVNVTAVTDEQATPAAIRAAIGQLAQMAPTDVAVVFFAGHGVKPTDGEDMVFVTSGAELRPDGQNLTAASFERDGVSWRDIGGALSKAKGRVLVMLDACHAGHISQDLIVPNEALARSLINEQRAGTVVFAASKGRQFSLEAGTTRDLVYHPQAAELSFSKDEPHGYFAGALLASLQSAATDRNSDGALQLSEIIEDVTRRVTRASKSQQTPWVARRDLIGDFQLAPAARR
jgi:hypothetical protein